MERDIKEIKEMLEALELIMIACAKILKDGKIKLEDLSEFFNLLKDIEKIKNGFIGIKKIPEEIKDLQEDELVEIGLSIYRIVGKIKDQFNE